MSGENNIPLEKEKAKETEEILKTEKTDEVCACDDIQKVIYEYLDNELLEHEKKTFENHISKCSVCKKVYEDEQRFRNIVKTSAYTPALSVADFVMEKIIGEKITINKPRRKYPIPFGLISAAVIIMAMLAVNRVQIGQIFNTGEWSIFSGKGDSTATESGLTAQDMGASVYNENDANGINDVNSSAKANIKSYSSGETEIREYALDDSVGQNYGDNADASAPPLEGVYSVLEKESEALAERPNSHMDANATAQAQDSITLPEPSINIFALGEESVDETAEETSASEEVLPETPEATTAVSNTAYNNIATMAETEGAGNVVSSNNTSATYTPNPEEGIDNTPELTNIIETSGNGITVATSSTETGDTADATNATDTIGAEYTNNIEAIDNINKIEDENASLTETDYYTNVRIVVQINLKFDTTDSVASGLIDSLNRENEYSASQLTVDSNTVLIECGDITIYTEKISEILTANNVPHSITEINPDAGNILLVFEP